VSPVSPVRPVTAAERADAPNPAARRRRLWMWARAAVGIAILAALITQVGAEPFLQGLAAVTFGAVVVAFALGVIATAAAAWRWRVIARRLGLSLQWMPSLAAYYRSQFLNTVLLGGIFGDVHRAVSHGVRVSRLAQASRAVVAERAAGQVVQFVLAVVVVVSLGLSDYAPGVGIVVVALAVVCVSVVIAAGVSGRARAAVVREWVILRDAMATPGTIVAVVGASVIVVASLVGTFLVACIAVGVDAPIGQLVGVALIVVLAGSIPLSIGGWGPREGVAAWAFMVAGLGATAGVAASTAYGVLTVIAVAPGGAVLAASALRRRRIVPAGSESTPS
jgi:glycosyltransferase 2 family protein